MDNQSLQIEMLVYNNTNKERQEHGLKPLFYNLILSNSSRLHSYQMAKFQFFSHENSFNCSLSKLNHRIAATAKYFVKNDSPTFQLMGENIADFPVIKKYTIYKSLFSKKIDNEYYTVESLSKAVVESWMNSPGHRANILNANFRYIGCGVVKYVNKQGMPYLKITQNFGS